MMLVMESLLTSINSSSPMKTDQVIIEIVIYFINQLRMKREETSSKNLLHQQSYRSLNKYRGKNIEDRVDQISKDLFTKKTQPQHVQQVQVQSRYMNTHNKDSNLQKNEDELRRHVKALESELKKKINENSVLAKLFRTKNHSEISHIDIYLEIGKMEHILIEKETELTKSRREIEEIRREYQQLEQELSVLNQHAQQQQEQHIEQIELLATKITEIQQSYERKLNDKQKQFEEETIEREEKYQNDMFILREVQSKNQQKGEKIKELTQKIAQLNQNNKQLQQNQKLQSCAKSLELIKVKEEFQTELKEAKDQLEQITARLKEQQSTNVELIARITEKQQQHTTKITKLQQKLAEQTQETVKLVEEKYAANVKMLQRQLKQKEVQLQYYQQEKQIVDENLKKQIQEIESQRLHMAQQLTNVNSRQSENCQTNSKIAQEMGRLQELNLRLQSESKISKYQKEEGQMVISKLQQEINSLSSDLTSKSTNLSQLQNRVFTLTRERDSFEKRNQQLQKAYAAIQELQHNSQQASGDLYKALGRLIELNHQVCYVLPKNLKQINNTEELNEIISSLATNLDTLINTCYLKDRTTLQTLNFKHKQRMDEIESILSLLSCLIGDQQSNQLTMQYVENLQISHEQYHKSNSFKVLQQHLLGLRALKLYVSENTHNREFLQGKQNFAFLESQKHSTKWEGMSHQSSRKELKKKRERFETQPVEYAEFNRKHQNQHQNDKQNHNTLNVVSQTKQYPSTNAQTRNGRHNWKSKEIIQKKYFRN